MLLSLINEQDYSFITYWDNTPLKYDFVNDPLGNSNDPDIRKGFTHVYKGQDLLLKANVIGKNFVTVEYKWYVYPHIYATNSIGVRPLSFIPPAYSRHFRLKRSIFGALSAGIYFQVKLEVIVKDTFLEETVLTPITHKFMIVERPTVDVNARAVYKDVNVLKSTFNGFEDVVTVKGVQWKQTELFENFFQYTDISKMMYKFEVCTSWNSEDMKCDGDKYGYDFNYIAFPQIFMVRLPFIQGSDKIAVLNWAKNSSGNATYRFVELWGSKPKTLFGQAWSLLVDYIKAGGESYDAFGIDGVSFTISYLKKLITTDYLQTWCTSFSKGMLVGKITQAGVIKAYL